MVSIDLDAVSGIMAAAGTRKATAVFRCSEVCRRGQCGRPDCNHRELDGRISPHGWEHDGCMCWLALEPR